METETKLARARRASRELEQNFWGMDLNDVESLRRKFDEIDESGDGSLCDDELLRLFDSLGVCRLEKGLVPNLIRLADDDGNQVYTFSITSENAGTDKSHKKNGEYATPQAARPGVCSRRPSETEPRSRTGRRGLRRRRAARGAARQHADVRARGLSLGRRGDAVLRHGPVSLRQEGERQVHRPGQRPRFVC